jgi:hypothetical protein
MKIKVFDIETAAHAERTKAWIATQESSVKPFEPTSPESYVPPKNIKNPEIIAERVAAGKAKIIQANEDGIAKYNAAIKAEQYKWQDKAALDWRTAQVISCAFEDLETQETVCFSGLDERKLLIEIGDYLDDNRDHKLAGQYNSMFDNVMLVWRYIYFDLGVPQALSNSTEYKPVLDCQFIGSYSSKGSQSGSLNSMCEGLGISGKSMSGSNVANLYNRWLTEGLTGQNTAEQELREYNKLDTKLTAIILRRFHKKYVRATPSKDDVSFDELVNLI